MVDALPGCASVLLVGIQRFFFGVYADVDAVGPSPCHGCNLSPGLPI